MEPSTFVGPNSRSEFFAETEKEEIRITSSDPNSASRIVVSEMMVLLNRLAADFAATNNLPVIFRTQEARDPLPPETLRFLRLWLSTNSAARSSVPGFR